MTTHPGFAPRFGQAPLEDHARLRAHAERRRAQLPQLPSESVVRTVLDAFVNHRRFHARMLDHDRKLTELRRRLRAEQADFSTLLEEERRRLACDWLLHSNRSVNQIALDLGYSEQSAFNRAFKRWFGVTPVSYRDSGGH